MQVAQVGSLIGELRSHMPGEVGEERFIVINIAFVSFKQSWNMYKIFQWVSSTNEFTDLSLFTLKYLLYVLQGFDLILLIQSNKPEQLSPRNNN